MALFSLCSVYEGCRLVFLFYLLLYFLCGVALCVAFVGHWGGTLVAFTVLVGFYWALGWGPCGVHSICSVYEACRLVCLLYLFIFCVVWRGVALRVEFMGHWGGALVVYTAFVASIRRSGWSFWWRLGC